MVIALLVLLVPAMLLAEEKCPSKAKAVCKATCKESMKLTEEQKAKIADLKMKHEIAGIKLGAELKILKIELKHALAKDDPSEKDLKALVSKIAGIQEKQHWMKIEHKLAMKKILGPELWKMHKGCCGGMGHGCKGMSGCCGGGRGCMGMMGGSGCGGMDKHIWVEKGGAGCCGMGEKGGHFIIKMDGSGCGEKTIDIEKIMKSCHGGDVKVIKKCIEGEEGKKIKIEKVEEKE
jgi:Spy/CpxP family protein refolding chaperone